MTGRPLSQELGKPGFVLNFFIEDRLRQVVGSMILTGSQIAEVGISPHCASFCLHQHPEHCLDVPGVLWQAGGWTGRGIMERLHVLWQFPVEFVDAGNQSLKVIAIFNASSLSNFFDRLPL